MENSKPCQAINKSLTFGISSNNNYHLLKIIVACPQISFQGSFYANAAKFP